MRSSDITEDVARQWATAWSRGDLDVVSQMISADATVEHNLPVPATCASLLETIGQFGPALDRAPILSLTVANTRAALLYDCYPRGCPTAIRLAEFLTVDPANGSDRDNVIIGVRRVFDLTALHSCLPGFPTPQEP